MYSLNSDIYISDMLSAGHKDFMEGPIWNSTCLWWKFLNDKSIGTWVKGKIKMYPDSSRAVYQDGAASSGMILMHVQWYRHSRKIIPLRKLIYVETTESELILNKMTTNIYHKCK